MPKCDNIPKRTAQDIFIGGNDILKETKRIIEAKSTIDVLFTDTKRFNAIVHIVPQSFYKICSQIQQNTEATIMNVFVFRYPDIEIKQAISNDSLLTDQFKSKELYILDSNDLDPDDQYRLLSPAIKQRATKNINPIILDSLHHNIIAKEYIWIMMLWKVMHVIFLLINTTLLIHLINVFLALNDFNCLYLSIGGLLTLTNFCIGIVSLFYITTNVAYKACDYAINYPLMMGVIFSAVELNVIPRTIPQDIVDYLNTNTHYRFIYHLIILFTVALLLFAFKLNEFFNEYNDRLPVKHSLIPDRIEEDELYDTDTGGYDYLNNSNDKYTQLI